MGIGVQAHVVIDCSERFWYKTELGTWGCVHFRQIWWWLIVPKGFGTRQTPNTGNMGVQAHVVVIVAAADQLMSLSSFHPPPADLPVMGSTRTPTDTSLTLHGH